MYEWLTAINQYNTSYEVEAAAELIELTLPSSELILKIQSDYPNIGCKLQQFRFKSLNGSIRKIKISNIENLSIWTKRPYGNYIILLAQEVRKCITES